jgi:hypothetical protein
LCSSRRGLRCGAFDSSVKPPKLRQSMNFASAPVRIFFFGEFFHCCPSFCSSCAQPLLPQLTRWSLQYSGHQCNNPTVWTPLGRERKNQVEPKTIESLVYALLVYFLVSNLGVMKKKGIGFVVFFFSVFTAISFLTNRGFIPVNENMVIFQKRSILLLTTPQILAGSTLFAPCLSCWCGHLR